MAIDRQGNAARGEEVRATLERVLGAADLELDEVEGSGGTRWMTMLSGEWKRTIPVIFHIDERHLRVTSLLSGAPDEGHEKVYELLLRRNQKPLPVHFALQDAGDIILTGQIPLVAIDDDAIDGLLGSILSTCDEVFNAVLRAGFAEYIDTEQRWRKANDLPPNPVSSAP